KTQNFFKTISKLQKQRTNIVNEINKYITQENIPLHLTRFLNSEQAEKIISFSKKYNDEIKENLHHLDKEFAVYTALDLSSVEQDMCRIFMRTVKDLLNSISEIENYAQQSVNIQINTEFLREFDSLFKQNFNAVSRYSKEMRCFGKIITATP